jgi:maltose/moltooligosaccharide transporter
VQLNWRNTFLLGFGFFAISLVWQPYNNYMPIFYAKYVESKQMIGWIMTLDNWLALALSPVIGYLSDRTTTRLGRRVPWILVGMPLATLFLFLIPFGYATSFALLFTATIGMNLSMSLFRAPTIALMPDTTPSPLRSKANGIINFMGGVGAAVAIGGGAILYRMNVGYPFYLSGVLLAVVAVIFMLLIREPATGAVPAERLELGKIGDRSVWLMLAAITFWFIGFEASSTWITTYGQQHLGVAPDMAAAALFGFVAMFILFAIPAGYIATRFGRKPTILTGLIGMMVMFAIMSPVKDLGTLRILFLVAGVFWSLININSFPMLWEMAPAGKEGMYTGMYYLFASVAAIAGPPAFGALFDHIGYYLLFPGSLVCFALAFLCLLGVRGGEAVRVHRGAAA